jgi:hypothetical protein
METYGFHFRYRLCGAPPTIAEFTFDDTEILTAGDLISVSSTGADLGASNDKNLVGAAVETVSGTADVTKIKVITDWDAVYAVTDATLRTIGTVLDITGTTGAMQLTTDSDHDVIVVANSTATEPTLVMLQIGVHPIMAVTS